jgi:hypothetical protein
MIVIGKDGPKFVSSLKSYIGKDLDAVVEKMEATGKYKKFYSREGVNGYRNVTMVKYGAHIEIVAEPVSEDCWKVLDIFVYNIAAKTSKW